MQSRFLGCKNIFIVLMVGLIMGGGSAAAKIPMMSLDDLIHASDLIVFGKFTECAADNTKWRVCVFEIRDTLKGDRYEKIDVRSYLPFSESVDIKKLLGGSAFIFLSKADPYWDMVGYNRGIVMVDEVFAFTASIANAPDKQPVEVFRQTIINKISQLKNSNL